MRLEHPLRRFRLAGILLAIVIGVGVTGYVLIDGWNFLDSFFMVIITISTVGYTEVHPQGPVGRLFTSGLIVIGVATMLYGFGVIVAEFEQHATPYVVIDQTEEALERIRAENHLHIEGDASKEEILRQAGIERAHGLISAVDSDERAVYIVLAARALNPNLYIVARAGRPESIRRLELAGATRTISPYLMAGHRMAELAIRPAMVDVLDTLHHGEGGIGVEEMVVSPETKAVGKSLEEVGLLAGNTAKVLAVRRRDGNVNVNPAASMRLEEGDLVIALGTEDQLFASASLLR